MSDLTGVPLHRFPKHAYESTSHAASVADFDCVHIFVDGSDLGDQSAAWSFVVLSQTERGFFFHGALRHSVLGAGTDADDLPLNSSSGEAMAMLWATLWVIQHCPGAQINLWSDSQATHPEVWESAAPGVLGELLSAVACALRVHSKPSYKPTMIIPGMRWLTRLQSGRPKVICAISRFSSCQLSELVQGLLGSGSVWWIRL